MTLLLAVDGGNSKTEVLVYNSSGTVLSYVRGKGTNHQTAGGLTEAMTRLANLVTEARAQAGLADERIELAAVYLAGADLPTELAMLTETVNSANWAQKSIVDNDTLALLRAGTSHGDAVAVVCGAGINCVGKAADGRTVRFPALGQLSGDWGGGDGLGAVALWHANRAEDGRGPATALTSAIAGHFGYPTAAEVTAAMHLNPTLTERIGELAPLVFQVAAAGDEVARNVVIRQGDEVVALATAALRRLGSTRATVVLGGGVLRARDPLLFETIHKRLSAAAVDVAVTVVTDPPVLGAALLGLDALGAPREAELRLRTWRRPGVD